MKFKPTDDYLMLAHTDEYGDLLEVIIDPLMNCAGTISVNGDTVMLSAKQIRKVAKQILKETE